MTPKIRQLNVSATVKTNHDTLVRFRRDGGAIGMNNGADRAPEKSSVL